MLRREIKYFQAIDNFCQRIYTSLQMCFDYQTIQTKAKIINFMNVFYNNRNIVLEYISNMVKDGEGMVFFLRIIQNFQKKWVSGFQVLQMEINMNVCIANKDFWYDFNGDAVMGSPTDQDGDVIMEVELFQTIEIDDDLWNIL
jgi:hypothetical protein